MQQIIRLSLVVICVLGLLAAGSGCEYAMPMPAEELRILPLREGADGRFLHEVRTLAVPGRVRYNFVAVSADGRVAAADLDILHREPAMSWSIRRFAVAVWDVDSGELLRLVDEGDRTVEDSGARLARVSPDGRRVILSRRSGWLEVRDIASNETLRYIVGGLVRHGATDSGFDESGRRLLIARWDDVDRRSHMVGGPNGVQAYGRRIWIDIETGEEADAGLSFSTYAECGDWVAGFGTVVNTATHQRAMLEWPRGRGGFPESVAFSGDCRFVAIGLRKIPHMLALSVDMTPAHVRVWNVGTGELVGWYLRSGDIPRPDDIAREHVVCFLPGSDLLLVRHGSLLRLLDVQKRQEIGRQRVPGWEYSELSISADGSTLIVPAEDGVTVYRIEVPRAGTGQ